MSTLLPSHTTRHVLSGLTEYLATSFSLANENTATALKSFLSDATDGMFRGPYVRMRLPFAQASGWEGVLEWLPSWFIPYHHQAQAFRRLSSVDGNGARRPEPTLVITGTGSGKTEAFLYPVLNHAMRARRDGQRGVKALLLYPMNALANDQASRLATLLSSDPALSTVTAGIYTGEQAGSDAKKVSKNSLITSREQMRLDPPDILITNYKMLDQLLLREADRDIWRISANSLQYLVLDEFHTYDGAQGTDVALLLRRLGVQLKQNLPASQRSAFEERPLGNVTPVATSATLGGKEEFGRVLDFATTIFGEKFEADAIVGEVSLTYEQWVAEMQAAVGVADVGEMPARDTIVDILRAVENESEGGGYAEVVLDVFNRELFGGASTFEQTMAAYVVHPLTKAVLGAITSSEEKAVPLRFVGAEGHTPLPALVLEDATLRQIGEASAEEFFTHFLAVAAHLRALAGEKWKFGGKRVPGVETHMWVREVSRIERAIAPDDDGRLFRWADDGLVRVGEDTSTWLPACYCRNCGRSGWMTAVMPGDTSTVSLNSSEIWSKSIGEKERQRPLIDATAEYTATISTGESAATVNAENGSRTLMWLHTARNELSSAAPTEEEQAEGRSIPVLSYSGTDAEEFARDEICPSCGERDSIRFIGSRVATLLSVGLSNLFGMSDLDSTEKKTLVFSDSVQDAAHRAGFVQSRSRAFGLRTQIRHAVGRDPEQLTDLPSKILDAADLSGDPARSRYELLPLELAGAPNYADLWRTSATAEQRRRAKNNTIDRLAFDLALEFGQRAHLSRSLTQTGTMSVYVDIADEVLLSAAAEALDDAGQVIMGTEDRQLRLAWTHGLIEMMRERGAIHHPWLNQYLSHDGNAWFLNRRDARARGIPAFPKGGAPEFPRAGARIDDKDRGITPVGSPRGRYALWTAQVLQCSRHDAATILTNLFTALAKRDALKAVQTESGGTIYALLPEQVIVRAEKAGTRRILECATCRASHGIEARVRGLLQGHRCFTPGCMGEFESSGVEENYYSRLYESTEPRAVVAKEHTGLIPKDERLALEQAFRGTDTKQAPDAPNVLVATPTLEMGIDIGDLSVVMLASLPTSVASYVQRVGRAGRLTGNSLVMAFVRGRGTSLPRLNDPLSIIGGSVNPPAAYLSATEILQRQVTAAIIDTIPFADYGIQIRNAASVFSQSGGNPALVGVLLQILEKDTEQIGATVDEFLDAIAAGEVDEALREQIRQWATGAGPDSLAGQLVRVRSLWDSEVKTLTGRRKVLEDRWAELTKLTDAARDGGAEDADAERELRATLSALRRIKRDLSDIAINEYWIAAMERYGLLPNFTLLDDSVELAVSVSFLNPSTLEFETEPFELSRGVSSALKELAPGATFYARGIAASIDSVELGREAENLEDWRLCPACSYGQRDTADSPGVCPACGSGQFRDKGQVLTVVPLRKVSAEVDRSRAMIDSTHEERYNVWFHEAVSFSVPTDVTQGGSWYLSGGFGAEHLRFVDISWFNLGRGPASTKFFGGREVNTPLFTVCHECGHLDSVKGSNSKWDHRPWCSKRNAQQENTISVALGRTLRTQGVLLHIPLPLLAGDRATVPSLIAAIKLGFKEVLGGDPDHLNIDTVTVPAPTEGTVEALLMYDSVPGGTGYLSAFASPEAVRNLLERAFQRVASCECANGERLACPDCLLPYTPRRNAEKTSRAIAERALRALLLNDNHPNADIDPLTIAWEPQEEAPEYDPSSHLEVRFREVVRQALEDRKVEVNEVARAGKMEWRLDFPNGEQWFMREQEDKGYTRPDFYFEHRTRRGVRPVAVFTDGLAYHASDAHFGFPADVERRARLATERIIPWTITKADLDWFDDEAKKKSADPGWMNPAQFKNVTAMPEMDDNSRTFLRASPTKQLLDYLAEPQRKAYPALGNAVALVAVRDTPPKRTSGGFTQDFDDYISIDFARAAKRVRVSRMTADVTSGSIDSRSWNIFWNIANMLWLSDQPVGIHTSATPPDLVDFSAAEEAAVEIAGGADIGRQWREAIEDYDDIDIIARAFHTLASAGAMPADEIGREMYSVVVAAVWDDQKVVIWEGGSSDHPDIADEMRNQGWTIIYPDQLTVEAVPARLQERK